MSTEKMDDQQRARELLAAEYRKEGLYGQVDHTHGAAARAAIAAITAALRAAPEGLGALPSVEHVRYWAEAYGTQAKEPHFQGHGVVAALLAEYAALLGRLAARPQGVKDAR